MLVDNAPFMLPFVNESIADYQRFLDNAGIPSYVKEVFFMQTTNTQIPPVNGPTGPGSPDPSIQQHMSYTGFFDGMTNHPQPALPSDLLVPKKLWQRTAGAGLTFAEFLPTESDDGLESYFQGIDLGNWEWRSDGLWWNGAIQPKEVRMRYIAQAAFFGEALSSADFATTPLPFRDCLEALALLVAEKFCSARLPAGATDGLLTKFLTVMQMVVNRHTLALQTRRYSRAPYGEDGDIFGFW